MENFKDQESFDIVDIILRIWAYKSYILVITFSVSILIFFISLLFPDNYKSEVVLAESKSSFQNSSNNNLGQVSTLARLAGLDMSSSSSRLDMAIEMMRSLNFFKNFSEKYNILPSLLAVDYWNKSEQKLIFNRNIYDSDKDIWKDSKYAENGVPSFRFWSYFGTQNRPKHRKIAAKKTTSKTILPKLLFWHNLAFPGAKTLNSNVFWDDFDSPGASSSDVFLCFHFGLKFARFFSEKLAKNKNMKSGFRIVKHILS